MSQILPVLSPSEWHSKIAEFSQRRPYFAMYSSVAGGLTNDPQCMTIPLDDHLVHRGDGIFEALRIANGAIYDLQAHLDRLEVSADRISLAMPCSISQLKEIVVQTARLANVDFAFVRIFVSRGPGSFSVSPKETVGSQLYVVVTDFKPLHETLYQTGARAIIAKTRQKPQPFAQIKSCNYLQNVLLKAEALAAKADFAISLTNEDVVAEGPTENIFIVDAEGCLRVPRFDYTLRGTTLIRVLELAQNLVREKKLNAIEFCDLKRNDLYSAREIAIASTTTEVLPLVQVDHVQFLQPFSVSHHLRRLLRLDIEQSSEHRTHFKISS